MSRLRARRRAQYFPVFVFLILGLFTFMLIVYNLFGQQTSAGVALDTAIRNAAYAAAQNASQGDDLSGGRWLIDAEAATPVARSMLVAGIVGESAQLGTTTVGSLDRMFRQSKCLTGGSDDAATMTACLLDLDLSAVSRGSGTAGGTAGLTRYGADIEIINPALVQGQTSYRTLNCVGTCTDETSSSGAILCDSDYPQQVASTLLDGRCFDRAVIVIRIALPVRQLSGNSIDIVRSGFLGVGTDVSL